MGQVLKLGRRCHFRGVPKSRPEIVPEILHISYNRVHFICNLAVRVFTFCKRPEYLDDVHAAIGERIHERDRIREIPVDIALALAGFKCRVEQEEDIHNPAEHDA